MRRGPILTLALVAGAVTVATPVEQTSAATGYQPLPAPQRLLDTRAGQPTADGKFSGGGAIGAGDVLALPVAGRAGVPAQPGSIVLNVTATRSSTSGFVTAWPCNEQRPPTANLNYASGQTIANTVISKVAPNGTVCFFSRSRVDLVVDAGGVLPGASFSPLAAPERLADTRPGETTVDGKFLGAGRRVGGSTFQVQVAGRGSIPADAGAAVLNVTATGTLDRGYLTIHPCDADRPLAANLTYAPGQTIPNAVLTKLDANGRICIFTRAGTHLVVDATGVLPDSVFRPLAAPRRLLDTRAGEVTADGRFQGGGRQPAGGTLQLDVAGRVGIPADVTAAVLNVTSTGSAARGFVTAHPQGSDLPTAANLNHPAGLNVSNLVIAGLGPTGSTCLFTKSDTHLVVDVVGWMVGSAPSAAGDSCPGRTTGTAAETLRTAYVRRPVLHRAVGTDRIAVYICNVPPGSAQWGPERHTTTAAQAAAWLKDEVAPWFAAASNGRYRVVFEARGSFDLGANDGSSQCRQGAVDRSGAPYTGAIGIDNTDSCCGFAGPGAIFSDPGFDTSVLDRPADQSRRGGWIGGGSISSKPDPAAFVHEIGHMLHWPHSFIGPASEYDNWVDVMSRGQGWCDVPGGGGGQYNCDPANTIAFNRFAAGWLETGDVIVHESGTVNYLLDKPHADGQQLVVLPDPAAPASMLTLEARPAVGNDDFFEQAGVALHVIDQHARTPQFNAGVSTGRRQRQAMGLPLTYDHVLGVGESATVHGVTVRVLQRTGDRYMVQVTGTYEMPGAAFFAEHAGASSCAALDHDAALTAGCVL